MSGDNMGVQRFQVRHESLDAAADRALPEQVNMLGSTRQALMARQVPAGAFARVDTSAQAGARHAGNVAEAVRHLAAASGRLEQIIAGVATTTTTIRAWDDRKAGQLRERGPGAGLIQTAAGDDAGAGGHHGATIIERDGRQYIRITPSHPDWPPVEIPNTVGATEGFMVGSWPNPFDPSHTYIFPIRTGIGVPFEEGRAYLNEELARNPTPGDDRPATPEGTRNDALGLGLGYVNSYVVPSPDPTRYTDTIVNYTFGDHLLAPGFVLRRGVRAEDGTITLETWGEGAGWLQHWRKLDWRVVNWGVWKWNQGQIEDAVLRRMGRE